MTRRIPFLSWHCNPWRVLLLVLFSPLYVVGAGVMAMLVYESLRTVGSWAGLAAKAVGIAALVTAMLAWVFYRMDEFDDHAPTGPHQEGKE